MGFFSSEPKVIESPTKDFMGQHLYHLDGIGANLFVYDTCVVIDRTQGGLFNKEHLSHSSKINWCYFRIFRICHIRPRKHIDERF